MLRDSLQVGKVPLSGQWSQQITKLKPETRLSFVDKVVHLSHVDPGPYTTIVDF